MIRLSALIYSLFTLVLIWYECGENPGVFCYRIGHGFFKFARHRALVPVLVPVPVSAAARLPMSQRINTACSTRFSTFSVRYIAQKD